MAKKEGRLLTKKQKEEKAAAERRRQALIASGVQIEGLQQPSGVPSSKKVVYGSRKKKGPRSLSPVPGITSPSTSPAPAESQNEADGAQDEWDASSAEEDTGAAPAPPAKDEWDVSSEDEVSAPPPRSESEPTLPAPPPSEPAKGTPGPYI